MTLRNSLYRQEGSLASQRADAEKAVACDEAKEQYGVHSWLPTTSNCLRLDKYVPLLPGGALICHPVVVSPCA